MPSDLDHRPLEAEHILTTLDDVGPSTMTSCPGWTSHQVAAHIAGNYQEVRRHAEAFSAGHPLQHTRSYEEREPPFQALTHSALLERLEQEESAMRQAIAEVLEQDGDATLQWTGRTVSLSGFPTHMRSEDALHRWDLLGDDDLGAALLGQQELLEHAVHFIGAPLCRRGLEQGAASRTLTARVRADGQDDLLAEIGNGGAAISVAPTTGGDVVIDTDAAARLLLLWGRKPMPFHRLHATGETADVAQLQLLFSGY